MADKTGIEWTNATWNPLRGCSRVSEGCRHCYAEKIAARFSGPGMPYEGLAKRVGGEPRWTGTVRLVESALDQPLRWTKPRIIFVNSMSDLFHEKVSDEWIDSIFAVMALAPQHTFQILTKRPERMVKYMKVHERGSYIASSALSRVPGNKMESRPAWNMSWPLPNVWLGVSVEDQKTADERIPLLLATPAAKRFISAEPLLGKVDLLGWGAAAALPPTADTPKSWSKYQWPDWIPERNRELIADFWRVEYGRGAKAWASDNYSQKMPATGARVGAKIDRDSWANIVPFHSPHADVQGRYIHHWNNIGNIITDDGRSLSCSAGRGVHWLSRWQVRGDVYEHRIHWVIAGGESGPHARPMHPDWARSLRNQCAEAGVPFFFKQWGEWTPQVDRDNDDPDWRADYSLTNRKPEKHCILNIDGGCGFHGDRVHMMKRVGKKTAGSLLDGREHKEFPA
ncbi:MAG: phage Gp37/Gp68 family protein [Betaproteobacteria bacterium]|nr:phage Gp37/Gp68 family protein [Betaproteobacteria bacterium]